ncbi:SusC/RagA family TonB-linked outer membrane protein [Dysgonomonas macrotermitis]|uniref:Iron complex outermembrane recepter protein n=1 Tax=Dysgonomonas macrotermitis TaxID=1346286 RepID=A0A1M4SFG0_9BACT|nr:TonB-dependent receptor [Dysgonomonas macrotermitis]SHE31004.1 iron complex outermembrane recepter protein [Dysgonomonas macrotermitis]
MKKNLKSNKKTHLFLSILFSLLSFSVFAQQHTVKGIVKDETGEPIIGVSVTVKGTTNGVITDVDGNFTLQKVNPNATIVFSYITYLTQEITYQGQPQLIVTLIEDSKKLDEVVVIGYGQVRKGDATGALTNIKADAASRGFAPNAQDMLTGKVAGVAITSEGGSPSGGASIRIRGGSSLSASNDPLIVVDGVFIDNQGLGGVGNILSTINPTDIESFTVLKDASATAIYGSRASNGVILITTKRGTDGKMRITYDGNVSVSTPKKKIDVLSGDDFRAFIKESFSGLSNYDEMLGKLGTANTNWQDEILRTTFNTEHNLSVYGTANKVLPYRVSFGYTNLNGILKTSKMERYTASFSLTPTLLDDHLKISVNGRGMYVNNRFADQNSLGAALVMDPSQSVYDENSPYGGFFTWTGNDNNIIQVATKNPVSMLEMTKDKSDVYNFIGNAQFDYKLHFLPDLRLNMNLGMDYSKSDGTKWISEFSPSDYAYGGYDSSWDQKRRNSTIDLYAQYAKEFDFLDSRFDVMGGYSWQHYWRSGSNIGYRITRYDEYGNPKLDSQSNYETEHYIVSFFGRLNYSIKDRYLLTLTLRNDGSSRFHKDNRWSLFPSVALAWRMTEESFLKEVDAISNLKLRLGWGMTGQQDINLGDYPYMPTYMHGVGDQASYMRGYNNGTPVWVSLLRPEAFNPDLKWETTTTYNAGIDYGFLNNRIDGSIDIYHRKTKDLINAETKTTAGTNFKEYVASNIGNLENTGFEFAINGRPIVTKDLTWEIGTNFAYNKNKITKLSAGNEADAIRRVGMNIHMVGQAANMYYVYEQIYDEQGKPIEGFYKDLNNDGLINEQDLRPYKNPSPDWTIGFNTKVIWKAWDLSIAGHGSLGNYNYNAIAANNAGLSGTSIYANEFLSNRVRSAFDSNFQTGQSLSDYYVQDASFFRIDNIVLGWSFKQSKLFPLSGRIYGTVQNPFVFTKYDGLDPEVFGGYDGNVYPRPLTILFGVNLNF